MLLWLNSIAKKCFQIIMPSELVNNLLTTWEILLFKIP
jgi:hypothetical protein